MTSMLPQTKRLLELWAIPEIREQWRINRSWGVKRDARFLPWPKGDPRRRTYARLRDLGVSREDAIAQAQKPHD